MPKAWGGCSLVLEKDQYAVTKEQPPLPSSTSSPPSQEGNLNSFIFVGLQKAIINYYVQFNLIWSSGKW